MPNSFAETPTGVLLIASGMDPMMRWDGFQSQAVPAGILPPATAILLGSGGDGFITGTYTAYIRFVDSEGNFSNLSPISNEIVVENVSTINYFSLPSPTESKVVRRQILRNTAGQATTYYVDIDTTDLVSQTLTSQDLDTQLLVKTAVPLLDSDGKIFANRYTVPPNHKGVLANHLGRMFALVDVEYSQGMVQVTRGTKTVTGVATEFTSVMAGRFLYVVGSDQSYEIASVDTAAQTLTLLANYTGLTDAFAVFTVRPAPAERKLVYYSEEGLAEAWPAVNALAVPEDGDDLTGAMVKGSFIYFLEKRHIYRFTFQSDPATDGFTFLSSLRGCINHRSWAIAEDTAYMLDEAGIHAFSGGQDSEPISTPIQDLFRRSDAPYRVNWAASRWFHACTFPAFEVVYFFVALDGEYLPRHAIAYQYRTQRWWLDSFPFPVASSALGTLQGVRQAFLGSTARRILAMWQGTLDGPDPAAGTVRGTVTAATLCTLTDSAAVFPTSGLVGFPVAITAGTGKGQSRIITAVSGGTLTLALPWLAIPDTTSVYQLGGVEWTWNTGPYRWAIDETANTRRVEVIYEPTPTAATMDLRIFVDFNAVPLNMGTTRLSAADNHLGASKGSSDLVVDLSSTKPSGIVQTRLDNQRETFTDGPRWVSIELRGFQGRDPLSIYEVTIDGAVKG